MRGMTAEDLFRIAWVSDARLSPDGRTVAFTVTRLDQEADDYRSRIWTVPAAGGEPRRFTAGDGKDSAPRWSPDGTRVAFVSDRAGGRPQLYVIDAGGGEARRLTDVPQGVSGPLWSPDGAWLLVTLRTGGGDDAAGDGPKTPPARVITSLKYRYNGEGFIYDRRKHLFVVDAESGATRQLTDGDWDDLQPAWSPDGRRIVFVAARHDERDHDRSDDLWTVAIDGAAEPVRVTPGGGSVALPAWSPDGGQLAYLGYADAEDPPRNSRLWVVPATGGEPRCLTAGYDRHLEISETAPPVWTADGAAIITGVQDRGATGVVRVETAGGAVKPVVSGPRAVTSYDLHPSGALVFVASDPSHPAEVMISKGGVEHQLTDLNAAWRAAVELPAAEHFTVVSEGVEVDGWLMRPAGWEPGRRYPALLNIHGGPFVQYGWNFFDEFQVQAGAGYAVVFANPRGSSGREEAFARALIGAPAEPMSADVLAVMDEALRRHDWIDPARTGVLGGSYGGYLAAWIIGHSDRFAAACAERGIYLRYSRELTGDVPTAFTYLKARPWEDPALYWRHSPIAHVEQMRTPVLIIHSEEDLRCPIEQGEQLFAALKRLRRDVRFIRFPGENHELTRNGKPSHRLQRFTHLLDWFRRI